MRVTLFAHVQPGSNPYIALLQQAVQPYCEAPVRIQPRFTLGWVLQTGKAGGIAHIHWIESHLRPQPWFRPEASGYHAVVNRLGNNRISHPMRATGLLVKLAGALALARQAGVRLVYTVHNLTAHYHVNSYYIPLERLANRLVFSMADAVHVHSRYAAGEVARLYGRARNVLVAPHGNYCGWYPNTLSRAEARLALDLPEDVFVYLFLGQIAPYKGLGDLIEAFLAVDDPSARLVIAGVVVRADYGARIATLIRHPRVLYQPGYVPDENVQIYLNAADVVALPYRRITTSGSALLAFSFGRPVVAPLSGGLPEIVPASAGLLYDPEEQGALSAALHRARSVFWSSQAILSHARQFDWRVVGPQIAHIYQAALRSAEAAVSSQEARS